MNVLKLHLQTTALTLLASGKSQREIERITRIDRKTIRILAQRLTGDSNSTGVATGSAAIFDDTPAPGEPGAEIALYLRGTTSMSKSCVNKLKWKSATSCFRWYPTSAPT